MKKNTESFYILQVSDFHISEDSKESAQAALKALTNKLEELKINISYLIHTGDVINSKDLPAKIAVNMPDEDYDKELENLVQQRLYIAENIMCDFLKKLDVLQKNTIICCGNHDKIRYKKRNDKFKMFQAFLKKVSTHSNLTDIFELDDLRVLVLNTNISDNKNVTCVDCENLKKILSSKLQTDENENWFCAHYDNSDHPIKDNKLNVIVAHQPLYDICEHIRLPYESETQSTDFLSALQDFISGNGLYLCGDKHTSSIAASYIHDIPHYFCGHPFTFEENNLPKECICSSTVEKQGIGIDYNLIEVIEGKIGQVRKLHLMEKEDKTWDCQIHPIDMVVSNLYDISKNYIVRNSFALLAMQSNTRYGSWANLSWRNLFNRFDTTIESETLKKISDFYSLFCRIKNDLGDTVEWDEKKDMFSYLSRIIEELFCSSDADNKNIINIRGDYSSSKSTFLGVLYIYLLYRYSYGEIQYIPAYFNMENDDILNKIQDGSTYSSAVRQIFSLFVEKVEKIAKSEHAPVCYIVDGLDEQDIWSERSQDSIGRVALDILAEAKDAKYIMSFCQNKLTRFKNTMPAIKYYEKNYVIYFNSITVKEKQSEYSAFVKFVRFMVGTEIKKEPAFIDNISVIEETLLEPAECEAIRKLRRLSVNPGFIYHNYQYLKECQEEDTINTVYMRYIDQQYRICLNTLGYNFVHYAPAMAYLFTYEGYTYERFKAIAPSTSIFWEQKILAYSNKIYETFIFIKKHKDAREFLLALHYNRELRYYAENPKDEILENSIINRLIPRNVSIIIKKMWMNDQNKFIIVCSDLIEKRKLVDIKLVKNSTLSMLVYILAHMNKIPHHIRDEIKNLLIDASNRNSKYTEGLGSTALLEQNIWKITGNNYEKIQKFIDLSFYHSQEILNAININNSLILVKKLLSLPHFALYNRQYMMWYYGDLTIYGENRVNNLVPGDDIIHKGIDYHKCFYTLYHKINSYYEKEGGVGYVLLEFDLFTICDLVFSRVLCDTSSFGYATIYPRDDKEIEVFKRTKNILRKYTEKIQMNGRVPCEDEETVMEDNPDENREGENQDTKQRVSVVERITIKLDNQNIDSQEEYVHRFFRAAEKMIPDFG